MRVLVRVVILLALGWLAYVLLLEAKAQANLEGADQTTTFLFFGAIVLLAVVIGAITALSLLPAIGESFGNMFYGSNEQIEKNPHSAALSKSAQGDFEGAIDEYLDVFKSNPSDIMALSEVVHIYCDRLHDYGSAAETLEEALEKELPIEESAFLCNRLVDVYWLYQHDAASARRLLIQIAETMPDTKHAANAQHRLTQIDHMRELGQLPQRPISVGQNEEEED
jgi:tetratricopeptide (TPR) repeat protein